MCIVKYRKSLRYLPVGANFRLQPPEGGFLVLWYYGIMVYLLKGIFSVKQCSHCDLSVSVSRWIANSAVKIIFSAYIFRNFYNFVSGNPEMNSKWQKRKIP